MNQVLKDVVYGKGTPSQADFLAKLGGMNETERKVLFMIHDGCEDLDIQETLGLDSRRYKAVESAVRAKLLLAVFECINCHQYFMEHR